MKLERTNGEMHNIEPTILTKTAAEQIDDYQMKIYEIIIESITILHLDLHHRLSRV